MIPMRRNKYPDVLHGLLGAFLALAALAVSVPDTADAQASVSAGLFKKGNIRLSAYLGSGSAFNDTYTILGVGGGYYIADGLELGLDAETWMGGDPDINRISPAVRYVFYALETVKPYVGAFYRRSFIEQFEDLDTAGVRGGLYFMTGRRAYIGVGIVYDVYLDCEESIYTSCSDTYSEFLFAITF
jgi:hypothetical protein